MSKWVVQNQRYLLYVIIDQPVRRASTILENWSGHTPNSNNSFH